MSSSSPVDKFYTIPSVSKRCLDKIGERYDWSTWDLVVEPSAGNGSFYKQIPLPKSLRVGMDILPEDEEGEVVMKDFFTYMPPPSSSSSLDDSPKRSALGSAATFCTKGAKKVETKKRHILVVGNPPFGRVSSLAVRFFQHASQWASVIAFILPRTFRRVSVQNKLHRSFHLVYDEDIPTHPCSFTPSMMAKCCFQIWERRDDLPERPIISLPTTHPDWDFLPMGPLDERGQPTPPTGADFAIRAYGGKCGEIADSSLQDLSKLRPKSWHWIRCKRNKEELIQRFQSLDYSLSEDTARQNSIGRGEMVRLYQESFDESASSSI